VRTRLTAAAVQLTSTADVDANLARVCALTRAAADAGAELIVLPENFGFLGEDHEKLAHAQPIDGPFTAPLREVARQAGVFVVAGGIPEVGPDADHVYNTSVLIDPSGDTAATYRKIHLFDVDLADGTRIQESRHVAPGDSPVVGTAREWSLGLTICYDLRFPELYRALVSSGADVLTVPAAFTLHTGKDHWQPLLRARAIENTCFVIAAAQTGRHSAARVSWGKSMIIDPWGTMLAVAPEGEGFALAVLDADALVRVRSQLPSLEHRKM
jgi:predicted amidohydrolase